MQRQSILGIGTAAGLLALAPLLPWPKDPIAFCVLGASVLFLERRGLTLDGEFRFSPAVPFYLAAGMMPSVGAVALGMVLLLETVGRRASHFLAAMEAQFPVALALLAMALGSRVFPESWWLPAITGPACYLLSTLALERSSRSRLSPKERIHWLRARHQLKPLQLILATASWAVAALGWQQPWLPLALVPVLSACGLAAENVVLKARTASTDQMLHALADARGQQRQVAQKLARAETEKQLMEGFSAHLARNPGLQASSQALVATVDQMVTADDVVVFLSSNPESKDAPEPFFYRASDAHQARLQGLMLSGLRESLVDLCWESGQPQTSRGVEPSSARLFKNNRVAAALPLSKLGILYVGRESGEPFTKPELQRLAWLAEKARLAFESAFRDHAREKQQQVATQQVKELQQRVALLGTLIRSAEEMAATLEVDQLADRLSALLRAAIRHSEGLMIFKWDAENSDFGTSTTLKRAWGQAGGAPPRDLSLLAAVMKSGQPLLVKDLSQSPFPAPSEGMVSAIASPLFAHDKICGVVVLGAPVSGAFGQDQLDQLRLIAYQAGMAFSNARLFGQVVVARQQLEESQESLVQSSKMSAIGKLAAGVAHELNTPLGVMNLALEQALEMLEERPQMAQRMVEKALKAIERSRSITERLLAYSRKPSGVAGPVRLDKVVEETLSFLSFELKKSQVKPLQELLPVTVDGRGQELQQVLVNLVMNALYAIEEQVGVDRSQALKIAVVESGAEYHLEVTDLGGGMSDKQRDQIFEPFYTTKPVGRGTGLGLWVSLQIMEQHKGRLEVESVEGQGSTFRMCLPK